MKPSHVLRCHSPCLLCSMSKKVNNLLIQPPLFLKEAAREQEIFHGMKCTHCHGNGFFWQNNAYGEREKIPCTVCKGTKRLKAVVTIEWQADDPS